MTHWDVFNGDADGLCSLHQLRLEFPLDSVLVTGVKRDVALLGRVPAHRGDSVTVLDVSVASNHAALSALLERGVAVQYFDHHFAGKPPAQPNLQATIDTSPDVCTGMLVDRYLEGRQRIWAVVAAFGDNLARPASALALSLRLNSGVQVALRELGENLAYNAYGDSEADLIMHPAELYRTISRYADPLRLLQQESLLERIGAMRRDDLAKACEVEPECRLKRATVFILPDAAWSRRVRGAFGNHLANRFPGSAHAVLTRNAQQGYTLSVRAPITKPIGADVLCRAFPSGGGRLAAAGINDLPPERLPELVCQAGTSVCLSEAGSDEARGACPRRQPWRACSLPWRSGERTRSTGKSVSRSTNSASLPMTTRESPRRPWVPSTMTSARHFLACLMIRSATRRPTVSSNTVSTSMPRLCTLASARASSLFPAPRDARMNSSK